MRGRCRGTGRGLTRIAPVACGSRYRGPRVGRTRRSASRLCASERGFKEWDAPARRVLGSRLAGQAQAVTHAILALDPEAEDRPRRPVLALAHLAARPHRCGLERGRRAFCQRGRAREEAGRLGRSRGRVEALGRERRRGVRWRQVRRVHAVAAGAGEGLGEARRAQEVRCGRRRGGRGRGRVVDGPPGRAAAATAADPRGRDGRRRRPRRRRRLWGRRDGGAAEQAARVHRLRLALHDRKLGRGAPGGWYASKKGSVSTEKLEARRLTGGQEGGEGRVAERPGGPVPIERASGGVWVGQVEGSAKGDDDASWETGGCCRMREREPARAKAQARSLSGRSEGRPSLAGFPPPPRCPSTARSRAEGFFFCSSAPPSPQEGLCVSRARARVRREERARGEGEALSRAGEAARRAPVRTPPPNAAVAADPPRLS